MALDLQEKKESTLKLTDMALEWFQAAAVESTEEEAPAPAPLVAVHDTEDDHSPLIFKK